MKITERMDALDRTDEIEKIDEAGGDQENGDAGEELGITSCTDLSSCMYNCVYSWFVT